MDNKFDELTISMAQSVTRRGALKKFGIGLAGIALATFGFANKAGAAGVKTQGYCQVHNTFSGCGYTGMCVAPGSCLGAASADCPVGPAGNNIKAYFGCGGVTTPLDLRKGCSFTI